MFGGGKHLKTSPSFWPLSKSRAPMFWICSNPIESFAIVNSPLSLNNSPLSKMCPLYSPMISVACSAWMRKLMFCRVGRFSDTWEGILNGTVLWMKRKRKKKMLIRHRPRYICCFNKNRAGVRCSRMWIHGRYTRIWYTIFYPCLFAFSTRQPAHWPSTVKPSDQ